MQSEVQIQTHKHDVCVNGDSESPSFLHNCLEEEEKEAVECDIPINSLKTMFNCYNVTRLGSNGSQSEDKAIESHRTSNYMININSTFQKCQGNGLVPECEESNKYEGMVSNKFSWWYFWSGGCGILFAVFNSCLIFCIWPQHHIFIFPIIFEFGPKYAPMKQRPYEIGTTNPTFSFTAKICKLIIGAYEVSCSFFFLDTTVKIQIIRFVMKSKPKHRKAVFRAASKVIATLRKAACLQPIS